MKLLARFFRDHPLVWVVPVLLFLGLVILAWMIVRTPESPYIYRI